MATYDAKLYPEAFEEMEAHRKTVYAVLATPEYRFMVSGDRLEFGKHGSITVGMVRHYASLDALVEAQGWQSLIPAADDASSAIAAVRAVPEWDIQVEQDVGVMGLRVREARRKE